MVFKIKRNRIGLHRNNFLVSDSKTVLFAFIEYICKILDKLAELLNGAVGLLVVA